MLRKALASVAIGAVIFGIAIITYTQNNARYALAQSPPPTVSYPASFAVSPPLSNMPASTPAGALKIQPRRPLPQRAAAVGQENAADTALQKAAGSRLSTKEQPNFPGIGENGYIPPDQNIAVGPNHIVQVVNVDIAVFDKSGNMYSGYPKTLSSIWSALGGSCASNNAGDPVVQYDKLADRFIITQLGSLSSPYSECIAVSTTNNPTGSYNLYSYSFGSNLNDYPKFGVWPTTTNAAYLATYNLFASGASFVGSELCAYDRTAMLSGAPAASICFTISGDGGFLPSDLDGPTAPLDGTPGLFLNFETLSSLRLYKLSANFATPSSSTLSAPTDIGVASFNEACGGGTCVPQPSTRRRLDSLGDRLMYRLAYRNFSDHEAMVVNHSVAVGSSVGVRWYELRDTPPSTGAAFNVYQQGTFAPDSAYRWMGSIATDQVGDIALGYSESSNSLYPSINYTGRIPSDTLGTMEAENILQSGGGSQTGYTRWGDYTSMRIDPSDDCTFWYTDEYYTATSPYVWSTAIGSFKFANCTVTPDYAVSVAPSSQTVTVGASTSYTVATTPSGGFTGTVAFSVSGLPTSTTASFNPLSVTASGSSTMTVSTATTTPSGTYLLTVTGVSGLLTRTATTTLVVSTPPPPDFSLSISPASTTVPDAGGTANYTVTIIQSGGFSSAITLSASGLPVGAVGSFSPNPTGGASSTLTITVSSTTTAGSYLFTVTGTGGSPPLTHTATATLVKQPPPVPTVTISANPTSITLNQSSTLVWSSTDATSCTASNAWSGTEPITGSQVVTPTSTGVFTYTLTCTGLGGSATNSATVTVTTPDFSLSISPSSVSVPAAGGVASYTVAITSSGGFSSAVTLSTSGLPVGAVDSFSPNPTSGASSTLTITVSSATVSGSYPFTVTGIGGSPSLTRTATATLVKQVCRHHCS